MPKGKKGFQPGHEPMGGRPEGSLNKITLTKLEARARFDEKVAEKWDEVIEKLLANYPVYVADQKMGKAADVIEAVIKKAPTEKTIKLREILQELDETS